MAYSLRPLTFGIYPRDASGQIMTFGHYYLSSGGMYAVYVVKDYQPDSIDDIQPWSYTRSAFTTITFSYPYTANSTYHIGVSAINGCGPNESEDAVWFAIQTDAFGNLVGILPRRPLNLRVTTVAAGDITVSWDYERYPINGRPTQFDIYELTDIGQARSSLSTVPYSIDKRSYGSTVTPTIDSGYILLIAVNALALENVTPIYSFFHIDDTLPEGETLATIE